ncbi:MAG: hypothetical protein NC247_04995 [Ruminococcus flavefaciens]|nr:hypothetical protein [Ruminococcus flavefaciens]MCM1361029.1 hypothetical protein [Clostridiales bacterium]
MKDVTLSSKQAHDFAMTICFSDILSYIDAHQAEYDVYIATERPNDGYGDEINE